MKSSRQELLYPIKVKGERVWRTYLGGKKLDALTGKSPIVDGYFPELWILSVVEAQNAGREDILEGLCYVASDGQARSLREVIDSDPSAALGLEHNTKYKGAMGVLVKMIDSKERLTIQVHPTREKAGQYFGSDFGKTECWHIVATREDEGCKPYIYAGFKQGVAKEAFRQVYEQQDLVAMLDMLHRIEVSVGDTFLITGGLPHAIGAGCTLIEIQEPTDYTLRTEQTTPAGLKIDPKTCHQGIGIDAMMDCFDFNGTTTEEILDQCKVKRSEEIFEGYRLETLIGQDHTDYFKMEKLTINTEICLKSEAVFYGLFLISGQGELISSEGVISLVAADQLFVSSVCEDFTIKGLHGDLEIIRFYGPK